MYFLINLEYFCIYIYMCCCFLCFSVTFFCSKGLFVSFSHRNVVCKAWVATVSWQAKPRFSYIFREADVGFHVILGYLRNSQNREYLTLVCVGPCGADISYRHISYHVFMFVRYVYVSLGIVSCRRQGIAFWHVFSIVTPMLMEFWHAGLNIKSICFQEYDIIWVVTGILWAAKMANDYGVIVNWTSFG